MGQGQTTAVVQLYLSRLAEVPGDASPEAADAIVRELLGGAVHRLHVLCRSMLLRKYPRLARPPVNLQPEEMLSAVTERMLKAMRQARPQNVRQFFALANQHMRWELNDVARRLDKQAAAVEVRESFLASPDDGGGGSASGGSSDSRGSQPSPLATRIFDAIDKLPAEEREAFDLVRVQEMTHVEAAEVVGVSVRTVQRRMNRALLLLAEALEDLKPAPQQGA